jgi:hypothetical protein
VERLHRSLTNATDSRRNLPAWLAAIFETLCERFAAARVEHQQAMEFTKKFHDNEEEKSDLCEHGAQCGWGKVLSDRFGIVGFPCPHMRFTLDGLTWEKPVERPIWKIAMIPQIWKEKLQIEWNPGPVEDSEPGVIPDGEESEEVDSSFLEELAHGCMRLSPVQVACHRKRVGTGNRAERTRNDTVSRLPNQMVAKGEE